MNDFDAMVRALAHPFRRKVLQWLADPASHFLDAEDAPLRGVSAGMIRSKSGLSQSTVSVHLSQLERARLVNAKRVGQWIIFSRNETAIHAFAGWLHGDIARSASEKTLAGREADLTAPGVCSPGKTPASA
ncbi:ArsR/SmtB family transcription factor [Paraburkholderia diazotrophica]|uniref:ArsR family transcriptional regulator n=1 Tax=Paraburkholderia diazotrophica TaxID=667676 RepID=A0A1H7ANX3_9BURK|nr:helix-turn-helix transcriptional regulator [Paraburkholderia diazotrophica]SEJ67313.1 ArsR family transcriptional regulator [Paraburkholderia diazotrophica]